MRRAAAVRGAEPDYRHARAGDRSAGGGPDMLMPREPGTDPSGLKHGVPAHVVDVPVRAITAAPVVRQPRQKPPGTERTANVDEHSGTERERAKRPDVNRRGRPGGQKDRIGARASERFQRFLTQGPPYPAASWMLAYGGSRLTADLMLPAERFLMQPGPEDMLRITRTEH